MWFFFVVVCRHVLRFFWRCISIFMRCFFLSVLLCSVFQINLEKWENQKGKGVLFNFDILDKNQTSMKVTGSNTFFFLCFFFRITKTTTDFFSIFLVVFFPFIFFWCAQKKNKGFHQLAKKWHPIITVNQTYLISNITVKPINSQYNKSTHPLFELHLRENTLIEPIDDNQSIEQINLPRHVPIQQIKNMNIGDTCDIFGIVTQIHGKTEIFSNKMSNRSKRTLEITDISGYSVNDASQFFFCFFILFYSWYISLLVLSFFFCYFCSRFI